MNNALGQYAIGGRLGDSIRERQGMAYYVFSSLDATFGPGPFSIRAGVAGRQRRKDDRVDRRGADGVLEKGFTAQEIDESKSYMIGAIPRQLETNAAIASFLLTVDTFDLGLDYDQRLPGLIGAITQGRRRTPRREGCSIPRARRSPSPVPGSRRPQPRIRELGETGHLIRAVFFDVDFTLIYPGPTFQAEGYRRACAAHGIEVDPAKFDEATAASSFILDEVEEQIYNARHLHPLHRVDHREDGRPRRQRRRACAREIYDQWSVNHHFEMYDDVAPVLEALQKRGPDRRRDLELASQPRCVSRAFLARQPHHACRCRAPSTAT